MRPRYLLWLGAALALALTFASASMGANGGELSPPLDDTFIHLQYARQLAEGEPFRYQPGAAHSTGATSLGWMLLLAAGAALGLDGLALYGWAMGLGAGLVAAAVWHTHRWVGRVADPTTGLVAAGALLLTGPWLWGAFSGMEIALFSAALAGVLDLGFGSVSPRARLGAIGWACALALARPEGALLVGLLLLARIGVTVARDRRLTALLPELPWALPVLAGAVQPLLNLALTGMVASSSALAKGNPRTTHPAETVALDFAGRLVSEGYVAHFGGPFGSFVLALFLLGIGGLLVRDREGGTGGRGAAALGAWLVPLLFLGAFLPLTWNHYRYIQPYLVVYVPVAAYGASRLDGLVAQLTGAPGRALVRIGFLAAWAAGVPLWIEFFALNSADIHTQHVSQARRIARLLPPDAVVAANDVGALGFLGERRVLDLEGIVSTEMLPHARAGEGAVFERILRERPDALLVFPSWFPSLVAAEVLQVRRHARLSFRTISGGDDLVLARLDAERARSGERGPVDAGTLVDTLDVSDLADEEAHGWSFDDAAPAAGRANNVLVGRADDGATLVDSTRRMVGPASFRMRRGAAATRLVGRFGSAEGPVTLAVLVDGQEAGTWSWPAIAQGSWLETSTALPDGAAGADATIELVPLDVAPGPRGGWNVARLWTVEATPPPAPTGEAPPSAPPAPEASSLEVVPAGTVPGRSPSE